MDFLFDIAKKNIVGQPTGITELDSITGVNGLPKGRIIEVVGMDASGKTSLALKAIAETQHNGGMCAFFDSDHSFNNQYAKDMGVDLNQLLFSEPKSGQEALSIIEILIQSSTLDLIVVDSVASLNPEEMGGEYSNLTEKGFKIDPQNNMICQALRRINQLALKHDTTVLFVNQVRFKGKIGVKAISGTAGGQSISFYASLRLHLNVLNKMKNGDAVIGDEISVKVVKNKFNVCHKEVKINHYYGHGIS